MPKSDRKRVDNHNAGAKLALRRHFLDKYHADGRFSVFDACQGSGTLWKELRPWYPCDYWGVDLKPKPGRLEADSIRLLEAGVTADVIDVDAYGSPWRHYNALLPNVAAPVTVFLTEGMVWNGGLNVPAEILDATGLRLPTLQVPRALAVRTVMPDSWKYAISGARKHGLRVAEIVESMNKGGSARYFGVRLEPEAKPPETP